MEIVNHFVAFLDRGKVAQQFMFLTNSRKRAERRRRAGIIVTIVTADDRLSVVFRL
jgi:hypothetical protein